MENKNSITSSFGVILYRYKDDREDKIRSITPLSYAQKKKNVFSKVRADTCVVRDNVEWISFVNFPLLRNISVSGDTNLEVYSFSTMDTFHLYGANIVFFNKKNNRNIGVAAFNCKSLSISPSSINVQSSSNSESWVSLFGDFSKYNNMFIRADKIAGKLVSFRSDKVVLEASDRISFDTSFGRIEQAVLLSPVIVFDRCSFIGKDLSLASCSSPNFISSSWEVENSVPYKEGIIFKNKYGVFLDDTTFAEHPYRKSNFVTMNYGKSSVKKLVK